MKLARPLLTLALVSFLQSTPAQARKHFGPTFKEAAEQVFDEATVSPPKDNEACFAPDEPCAIKLVKFIQSAKESVDIAIFDLSNKEITDAMIAQSKKIKVRVVLDPKQSHEKNGKLEMLKEAKVNFKYGHQKGIMHNKFTIVDHKRLETGSFNYTYRASKSNQENQLYLSTPSVITRYDERFEKIWKGARD